MDIAITKGKIKCAKKVVIYGPEGIGKSTLASRFPDPVFIDTEGSTNAMDISRLPKPTSWTMLLEEVDYVRQNPDVCRTLVIDTTDWAEQMCIQSICDKHQKDGIESFGYGTGYVYVREEFGRFLNKLSEVVEKGSYRKQNKRGNYELLYNGKMAIVSPELQGNKMTFLVTAFKTTIKK